MQAAVGVAQLDKLDGFIAARAARTSPGCTRALADLDDVFVLPEATPGSEPSWFGFPLAVRADGAARAATRSSPTSSDRRIATRLLFAGNLLRQPAYARRRAPRVGDLHRRRLRDGPRFWLGVYPGLGDAHVDYVLDVLHDIADRGRARQPALHAGAAPPAAPSR